MIQATNWTPGLIVLALGVVAGAILLLLFRKKKPAEVADDNALANLERRAQLLIEQLKELAADRHQLGEERYASEKARLELEAAAALRARDEYATGARPSPPVAQVKAPQSPAAAPGFFARNPQLKGALWGGGVVLFFVVLGLVLSQEEKPRQEGGTVTGKSPPMQSTRPPETDDDKELRDAMTHVADHPEDLETAARVAHELIRLQRFDDAERITEQSLGFDPFSIEHRIHRAVLQATHDQSMQAASELEHLAKSYPHAEEARLFLGGLRMEIGDHKGALDQFERYAAEVPPEDQPPQLSQVIVQLRGELGQRSP